MSDKEVTFTEFEHHCPHGVFVNKTCPICLPVETKPETEPLSAEDVPPPDFRSLAETVAKDALQAYRISELLLAAYNAGVRYKTEAREAALRRQLAEAEAERDNWYGKWNRVRQNAEAAECKLMSTAEALQQMSEVLKWYGGRCDCNDRPCPCDDAEKALAAAAATSVKGPE
jgi:hypothetical protein